MDSLKIALAIQNIALLLDDESLNKVSDKLKVIEKEVSEADTKFKEIESLIKFTDEAIEYNKFVGDEKNRAEAYGYEKIRKVVKGTE